MPEIKIDRSLSYIEGTQRVYDEATTLENTKDQIKKIGVTRIADITNLDRLGIPIFSAIRPSAAQGAISIYSGKGSTEQRARISAVMESFERCLAERPGINANIAGIISAPTLVESYAKARENFNVMDPKGLLLPQPYTPQSLLEWVGAYDLVNREEVFVSANAVYHPYDAPGQCQKLFLSNTNGLASGNVIEEAVLHGLLEVIERDAISTAQFTRNLGKEIVLTEEDRYIYELSRRFKDAEIELKIWLVPTDTGIPTVIAATDDLRLKDPALLVMGAGSHLKPEIAVARAVTEAAQSRVVQIQGAREDTDREGFIRSVGYDRMKRLNCFWFEEGEKVSLSEVQDLSRKSPAENIDLILEKLRGLAEKVLVIDLSREEVAVPVVRVIIPGFELFTVDRDRKGKRITSGKKRDFSRDRNDKPWKRR
jgi:ribosomal protein S12 methylthiotransferase accessory factor